MERSVIRCLRHARSRISLSLSSGVAFAGPLASSGLHNWRHQMQRRYITVDVFTDRAFGGNPLAVVLDAAGLSTAQMHAIASEFNYSETTFVLPPRNSAYDAQVRIFTVREEIPFAGHPNVGTAFALATLAAIPPTRL